MALVDADYLKVNISWGMPTAEDMGTYVDICKVQGTSDLKVDSDTNT